MFLGLFQLTLDKAVEDVAELHNFTTQQHDDLVHTLEPLRQTFSWAGFMLTSCFVVFFAVYRTHNRQLNLLLLLLRLLSIFVYAPLLAYCGAFLDAVIVLLVLAARLSYVCFFACLYKNTQFILLNSTTLWFYDGFADFCDSPNLVILEGDESSIKFAGTVLPFAYDTVHMAVGSFSYIAVRGRVECNLSLVETVDLSSCQKLRIFMRVAPRGVANSAYEMIQLDECSS
uniref:Non-structural 3c protein n=1 Tax=Chaerephon bat coronavirus TaxID=2991261 RepID=A0AB38ZDW5_9NIDO